MNTDELIGKLSSDLDAVKPPIPTGFSLFIFTGFGLISSAILLFSLFRLREDYSLVSTQSGFLLNMVSLLGVAFFSAWAALYESVPGKPRDRFRSRSAFLFGVVLFANLFIQLIGIPAGAIRKGANLDGFGCTEKLLLFSIIPAISFFLYLRRLAPIRLSKVSLLGGLAVSAIGAFTLSWACSSESASHQIVWHALPIISFSMLSAKFGAKVLKW